MDRATSSGRRWMFWAGCLLLGLFAALSLVIYLATREGGYLDAAEVDLLAKSLEKKKHRESPDATGWPQWRGPWRDGHSAEKNLYLDWSKGNPPKLWEAKIGDGFGGIVAGGGRVYTLFQSGEQEVVGCWDAKSGAEIWRHAYAARFEDKFGAGPRGTPTLDGDLLFTAGGTGNLHCLDAAKGKVIWTKDMRDLFGVSVPGWGFAFSPLVADDLVFVVPGGKSGNAVAALERKTGNVRWQGLDVGGGYSSPIYADVAGQKQIIFFAAAGLVGVVPETGKELWRFPWVTSYDANIATPIVLDNYVFLSSGYGKGCALIRLEKGEAGGFGVHRVYEHRNLANHFSSSIFHGGHVYGFHGNGNLVCVDLLDGKGRPKWGERDFERGSLILVEDHLIILGENGRLGIGRATPAGWFETGRMDVFDGPLCWSAPALADGRLFVRDRSTLVCLDLRK